MANKVSTKKKEPRVKMVEKDFNERIIQLYKEQNKSISAMAKDANISPAAMNYYLSGDRMPDLEGLRRICDAFNCSADWLLGLTDVRSSSEDVKTAVKNLGIEERFITKIKKLDDESRRHLFNLLDTPGFNDILISEYMKYKIVQGERFTKILEKTDDDDEKNQVVGSGNVVLSKEEAVKYYAERVGHTLATILLNCNDHYVSFYKSWETTEDDL